MKEMSSGRFKPEAWGEPDIKYAKSAALAFLRNNNNTGGERSMSSSMAAFNAQVEG
jgi:hypothetical protein